MPSLKTAVLYAIISAASFIIASDYGPKPPIWVRFILVAIGMITAAGAVVEAANWLSYVLAHRLTEIRRMRTITPVTEILRLMSGLSSSAQVELALHFNLLGIDYRMLIGHPAPSIFYTYDGHNIPFDFISDFFHLSTDRFLPSVRQWGEGSHEHMWADALTALLVKRKYAEPARGPNPAAWLWEHGTQSKRRLAMEAFGLIGDDNDE